MIREEEVTERIEKIKQLEEGIRRALYCLHDGEVTEAIGILRQMLYGLDCEGR